MKQTSLFRFSVLAFFTPIIVSLTTSFALAGGQNGGGGDAIICADGKVYSLDYELDKGSTIPLNPPFLSAKTARDVLAAVQANLQAKIPALGQSLADFLKFNTKPIAGEDRLWLDSSNPLVYLDDQQMSRLPKDCVASNGKPNVLQAVIRIAPPNSYITYQRDPAVFQQLAQNSALQVSFAYIHEWLRDFTNNVEAIRNINWYLHSTNSASATGEDLRAVLSAFGIESVLKMQTAEEIATITNNSRFPLPQNSSQAFVATGAKQAGGILGLVLTDTAGRELELGCSSSFLLGRPEIYWQIISIDMRDELPLDYRPTNTNFVGEKKDCDQDVKNIFNAVGYGDVVTFTLSKDRVGATDSAGKLMLPQ